MILKLTTYQFKNHSPTDGRYRYTCYGGKADGAEEHYDHSTAPTEHHGFPDPSRSTIFVRLSGILRRDHSSRRIPSSLNHEVINMNLLIAFSVLCLTATNAFSQSLEQLRSAYSGALTWDKAAATVRFGGSGAIHFKDTGERSFIWQIPPEVRQVIIAKGVTVNGAFHSKTSVAITGEDRKSSVVSGTDEPRWSQNRGIKAFTICTFQNFGGVMTISNLTSLNPRGFHVRGWDKVVHASSCDFVDRRGGHHNNSDGFEGGGGSTVHDCYFESGDDIIKVYHDVTVTDTTIKMITNTVPIQLGWGDYSDGAVGTFRNLRVLGDGGRGAEGNAIISGRQGRYRVTVNIDGCHVENPNGTLVSMREDTMTLRGAITNAHIQLKNYAGEFQKGTNLLTVCGTTERKAVYDCGKPAK